MGDSKLSSKRAQSFFKGFKDFISRGNIIDLAVGVIIGGAFGKIVTSLVKDIITPPISLLFKGDELKDAVWVLREQVIVNDIVTQTQIALRYGNFMMLIIEFIIIAFSIYAVLTLVIRRKEFNESLAKKEKAIEKETKKVVIPEDIKLLTEIRDMLKEQRSK